MVDVALTEVSLSLLLTFPINLRISIYVFSYINIYDYHACSLAKGRAGMHKAKT